MDIVTLIIITEGLNHAPSFETTVPIIYMYNVAMGSVSRALQQVFLPIFVHILVN